MPKKRKRPTLLRRLVEEIHNFLSFYETAGREHNVLDKAMQERIIKFTTPPKTKFHQKVVELLREYFTGEKTKLNKAQRYEKTNNGGKSIMPKKVCAICGVEEQDVFDYTSGPRVLGTADELLKSDGEVPKVAVVDIPVTRLCAYCADLHGVKHPNPDIAEGVRYYTDLMKRAVPKLQEQIVPPERQEKVDVDKIKEALFILQDAVTKLAREKEKVAVEREVPETSGVDYPEEPEGVVASWRKE